MKKFAIAASLVAAVALGAFAKGKFLASATAYFKNSSNQCIALTAASGTPFDTKGLSDSPAQIQTATGGQSTLYTESTCTTIAKFVP